MLSCRHRQRGTEIAPHISDNRPSCTFGGNRTDTRDIAPPEDTVKKVDTVAYLYTFQARMYLLFCVRANHCIVAVAGDLEDLEGVERVVLVVADSTNL